MNSDNRISFRYSDQLSSGVITYGVVQRFDITHMKQIGAIRMHFRWCYVLITCFHIQVDSIARLNLDVSSYSCCIIITHAPLFRGGEDRVCESPLGDSSFVMNTHNPFMHCVTSQYVFKLCDVIMLLHAVTMVTA